MKANELRIGNLVYNGFNEVVKIHDIISQNNTSGYLLETLKPIPLTEEILLKCGFERDKDFNTVLKIKIETLNGNHVIFIDIRANVLFVGNIEISDFNHLHELQNLIYSLTKKIINYESKITN
jgi:hypothetical protein